MKVKTREGRNIRANLAHLSETLKFANELFGRILRETEQLDLSATQDVLVPARSRLRAVLDAVDSVREG